MSTANNEAALLSLGNHFKVNCVCGTEMVIKQPSQEYNTSGTWCDSCKAKNPAFTYYCPAKHTTFHSLGYDYCFECAVKQFKIQTIARYRQQTQQSQVDNDEGKENASNDNAYGGDRMKRKSISEQQLDLVNWSALQIRYERHNLAMAKQSLAVLAEYKRFLVIKAVNHDFNATLCSPSFCIDEMWHLHVLDTAHYNATMKVLFAAADNKSGFIHHDVDGGLDIDARQQRYVRTYKEYEVLFGCAPDHAYWNAITSNSDQKTTSTSNNDKLPTKRTGNMSITVKTLSDKVIPIDTHPDDTVSDIKAMIQSMEGIPLDHQRLIFAGKQLEDSKSLAYFNIQNGATVHLVLRLC